MAHSDIDIQHTAKLARLKLTESESVKFHDQIGRILDYMSALDAHDFSDVEPTAHAMPVYDVWRSDEPHQDFTHEQSLSNAPKQNAGQFLISRVVDE